MPGRRERWGVAAAILAVVEEEERTRAVSLTQLAARANLSYGRLQEYLLELEMQGLVSGAVPTLTPAGREFLLRYRAWVGTLAAYGFDVPPTPGMRPTSSTAA